MRALLVRRRALAAAMTGCLPAFAIMRVGTDIHPTALVVGDDLVEIGILGAAQRAWRIETIARERMVLEVERDHLRKRRNRIDTLLAAGAEQLQRRTIVHLGIVKFRRRRRVH